MIKLGAKELRVTSAEEGVRVQVQRHPLYIIVDNVLDTYNIGAIFRLADAVGVKKIYLCGDSETPPNSRIKKASINTTEWVEWEYAKSAGEAIRILRETVPDVKIYSVELDERSVPYDSVVYQFPVALVVGHESDGVSQEAMDLSDAIVELPMWGVNKSLNVMVSLGIVLYEVMEKADKKSLLPQT
jgi:tRNA G18 (ribose-2'-O)-methylase SpoU